MHSIPLVALGTGLLWFGWYGFNAGTELRADAITGLAFLNTDCAASFAAITWLAIAWVVEKKPKFVGLLTGAVAGLATVTPCAGYVSTPMAILIGILSGVVCYLAVSLKNKLQWDDALDVWGVHGVGGVLGTICLGLFGSTLINPAGVERPLLRRQFVLPEADRGRAGRGGVRLPVHLRDALADEQGDEGQDDQGRRGEGSRRVAARRDRLRVVHRSI